MKQLNLDKIKATLERVPEEFDGMVAQIGFPSGINYEDGTPVAYVATIQEFGAPEVRIPPRPFMRPTVKAKKKEWSKIIAQGVPRVVLGKMSAFDVLDLVGIKASADIQTTIAGVYSPPLSPITVLLRKWKKEGRKITGRTVGEASRAIGNGVDPGSDNKPLNASGLMVASVRNAVAKTGSDFTGS